MKKKQATVPLPPSRGVLAKIAKEDGVSSSTMTRRWRKGDPALLKRVAELERKARKEQRDAYRMLAKALGA